MSKIKDLMELNIWMGSQNEKNYLAIMENKRSVPKDRKSILRELFLYANPPLVEGKPGREINGVS